MTHLRYVYCMTLIPHLLSAIKSDFWVCIINDNSKVAIVNSTEMFLVVPHIYNICIIVYLLCVDVTGSGNS